MVSTAKEGSSKQWNVEGKESKVIREEVVVAVGGTTPKRMEGKEGRLGWVREGGGSEGELWA